MNKYDNVSPDMLKNTEFFMGRNATKVTKSPLPKTNIRLGSQEPATSRKPKTFLGFIISEMASPRPNNKPESSAAR